MSLIADDIGAGKIAAAVRGRRDRGPSRCANALGLPARLGALRARARRRPPAGRRGADRPASCRAWPRAPTASCRRCAVTDTVKRLGADGAVAETFDRPSLRAVQTPQGFPVERLRAAIERGRRRWRRPPTAPRWSRRAGGRVICVEGDPRNLKVTTADDLRARRWSCAG